MGNSGFGGYENIGGWGLRDKICGYEGRLFKIIYENFLRKFVFVYKLNINI